MKSDEVKSSLDIFPRKAVFGQLSSSNQDNAITIISEIAIKIAQLLLPKEAEKGASTLLLRMTVRCSSTTATDGLRKCRVDFIVVPTTYPYLLYNDFIVF
jgi:hypothetical protein